MRFGVHLPQADLGEGLPTVDQLVAYTTRARQLGFVMVAANDHVVWHRPWLDGLTTLTAIAPHAGAMTLVTSVTLPVVRHPVVLAKALSALAVFAQGPVIAGLGPGSSRADYASVGVAFDERWARFDEALPLVRALLRGEAPASSRYYPVGDLRLDPLPDLPPQVWFGSWGSDRRLRTMAAVADGWMASGYNTTPAHYADARRRLDGHLREVRREPDGFPDLIATMWLYVTEDRAHADDVLDNVLAPLLARDPELLRRQLPIGPPSHCVDLLNAYAAAGAQRILLWPLRGAATQLERFADRVMPYVAT